MHIQACAYICNSLSSAELEAVAIYHSFPLFIDIQQALIEFKEWIHGKGKSCSKVGHSTYDCVKASESCCSSFKCKDVLLHSVRTLELDLYFASEQLLNKDNCSSLAYAHIQSMYTLLRLNKTIHTSCRGFSRQIAQGACI